jgi:hypothetical protein
MKTIIAGSRGFQDYTAMLDYMATLPFRPTLILSGTAEGADTLGELYASQHNIPCEAHPADWIDHGKKAGQIRNKKMGDIADVLVAFWDGESRGTAHMISYMQKLKKPVLIYKYRG